MKVGIVTPPWAPVPPDGYGGIELIVDRLATGVQRAGHDVVLFTTGDSTSPVPRRHLLAQAEGGRIGNAVPELRHVLAAYDELAGCDVVHDHTILGPAYAAAARPGLRVVTTIHGPLDGELSDLYRRVAALGVPLIAISHAQAALTPDLPVARVIHHGLDPGGFPVGRGDGGYCLFLGRMSPDKGAHRAIAAARKAGVRLLMAAKLRDPAEYHYFEAEVGPQLGPDAEYLGEVTHEEKLALLGGAMALLFPIRWPEPFGLVMIEALACGTPVIAFPEGAAPEVVDDGVTGFLCDSEVEMADAIGRLGEIDRAACRAVVEGHFSDERMVADHLVLFEELARGQ